MKIQTLRKLKIPKEPGVYFFKKGGEILYIGKATDLNSRIKSYFGADLINTRGPVILEMVFKASSVDWQKTDSVLEALILEAELIKKHQPKYNTKEKSDKSFNYVVITKEKLPRVLIVRGKELQIQKNFAALPTSGRAPGQNFPKSSAVFGPYPNGSQLKEAMKIIRRIFPYLDEKSKNYSEFYHQIDLIPDLSDKRMYLANIKNIKLFFQGKKKKILQNLKKEMRAFAEKREFEKAGETKRQIFALSHINDVALLKEENFTLEQGFRVEAYDIAHMSGKNMVGVMTVVVDGRADKNEYRKFKIRTQDNTNDTGALKEIIDRRLGHPEWPYPNLIVVDGGAAQMNAAQGVLNLVGVKIPIVSVLKDERHKPKDIKGDKRYILKHERGILLANSEAHRFAVGYHKNMRSKNFLK